MFIFRKNYCDYPVWPLINHSLHNVTTPAVLTVKYNISLKPETLLQQNSYGYMVSSQWQHQGWLFSRGQWRGSTQSKYRPSSSLAQGQKQLGFLSPGGVPVSSSSSTKPPSSFYPFLFFFLNYGKRLEQPLLLSHPALAHTFTMLVHTKSAAVEEWDFLHNLCLFSFLDKFIPHVFFGKECYWLLV